MNETGQREELPWLKKPVTDSRNHRDLSFRSETLDSLWKDGVFVQTQITGRLKRSFTDVEMNEKYQRKHSRRNIRVVTPDVGLTFPYGHPSISGFYWDCLSNDVEITTLYILRSM